MGWRPLICPLDIWDQPITDLRDGFNIKWSKKADADPEADAIKNKLWNQRKTIGNLKLKKET